MAQTEQIPQYTLWTRNIYQPGEWRQEMTGSKDRCLNLQEEIMSDHYWTNLDALILPAGETPILKAKKKKADRDA